MAIIGMIVLCLMPIFYIGKSKGYNATAVCVISGIISCLTPIAHYFISWFPNIPLVDITLPLVILFIVWLLPARKGAPGKAYLKIAFPCPECGKQVTFGREREGCVELCPECGEILTVPLDEFSRKSLQEEKRRPDVTEGDVCLEECTREEDAMGLQIMLESNGVASRIVSNTGGGVLGPMAAWRGFKVTIDVRDWDKAVDIQKGQPNLGGDSLPLTPQG